MIYVGQQEIMEPAYDPRSCTTVMTDLEIERLRGEAFSAGMQRQREIDNEKQRDIDRSAINPEEEDLIFPKPTRRIIGKCYSDEEIAKIKAEEFAAGKAAAAEESKTTTPDLDTQPIHRAMANNNRIGNVFAHRTYWLPNE